MSQTRPLQTFRLKERVAKKCRLSFPDVALLLAQHRAHIQVAATPRQGHFRLTALGHVGTIIAPNCRLVIRPKIPVANLAYLLDPISPLPTTDDRVTATLGDNLLDFLAARLARLLEERTTAGLHRAYAERKEQGPFLHGQLDLPSHLLAPNSRKDRLHSRYEDFTADVPCNQLARATAELVCDSPLLGENVKQALRQALRGYAGVTPAALGPALFQTAEPTSLNEAYRPLFDLCRLLADGLTPGERAGPLPCPAFLLDMERVFEDYCVSNCVRHWHNCPEMKSRYHAAVQPLHRFGDLHMRPDLVLHGDGVPVLVLDAKWKKDAVQQDIYQVLAYSAALGVRQVVLVYPGRRDSKRIHIFERTGITLTIRKVRVLGNREQCQQSARRLAQKVFLVAHSVK